MSFDFSLIAERRIQEAIDEGAFEDLPGKGRPLILDDLPPHLRILRNAGVLPDWMQMQLAVKQERQECARMWDRMVRDYSRRRHKLAPMPADESVRQEFARWLARSRQGYITALRRVNTDILKLNLKAPAILPEQPPFRVADEAARFDAAFPPLPDAGPADASHGEDAPRQGGLRDAVRERYGRGGRL